MTVLTEADPTDKIDIPWPQTTRDFEAVFERMQHELMHFACCRLGNRQDAEDAVQEVLVRAFCERVRYRHVSRFTPFVYRMLINRCTDVLRKRKHTGAGSLPEASLQDDPLANEEGRRLRTLLDRIPAKEAEVVRLRLWAELPFEEIARVMDTPVPTAKSRYRYALERLRSLIRGEGR